MMDDESVEVKDKWCSDGVVLACNAVKKRREGLVLAIADTVLTQSSFVYF
jgi:hypothetical protein